MSLYGVAGGIGHGHMGGVQTLRHEAVGGSTGRAGEKC